MIPVLLFIIITGLLMGFVSTSLSHLLPKLAEESKNDKNIGTSLIFFGIGTCLGGALAGRLSDKIKIKNACMVGVALF